MITLYHRPQTRATRFIVLLEELGAPYTIRTVTLRQRDGSGGPDPANPHPHGKVPAISDDGVVVFESPAIALYLTDKFPQNRLGPLVGDPLRGPYLSWLAYYGGEFEPAFMCKFMKIEAPRPTAGWASLEEVIPAILARLERGPYLLGDTFTAVDVLYGSSFALFGKSDMLPKSPLIEAYARRFTDRPAVARAMAKEAALAAAGSAQSA
jgi:glutathione S-transferase